MKHCGKESLDTTFPGCWARETTLSIIKEEILPLDSFWHAKCTEYRATSEDCEAVPGI